MVKKYFKDLEDGTVLLVLVSVSTESTMEVMLKLHQAILADFPFLDAFPEAISLGKLGLSYTDALKLGVQCHFRWTSTMCITKIIPSDMATDEYQPFPDGYVYKNTL